MKKQVVFTIMILLSIVLISASLRECKSECLNNKKIGISLCKGDYEICKEDNNYKLCYKNKTECLKKVKEDFIFCNKKCIFGDVTCLNGTYKAGDIFLEECKECECTFKGKINCKKTDFCNFDNPHIDENTCALNGGLFQQLCNGPYFDIVCSADNFCLCDGYNNHSCPDNYFCLHQFSLSLTRRGHTIEGWKSLIGDNLGNIGICVKKPFLENCGNGICENIVVNNMNAETELNCPSDCKL